MQFRCADRSYTVNLSGNHMQVKDEKKSRTNADRTHFAFVSCKFGGQKMNCEFRLGISVESL